MSAFQPGHVIGGRYRLVRVIGAGAMGVVWSARHEGTERDFAIKLLAPDALKDPARLQRLFKEAKLAGRLRHRSIVEVYDLGRLQDEGPRDGAPYLVMELLDGEPLDALLRRVGQLPAGTALRVVSEVARGVAIAHAQGVIHRDLKPANVFLHRTLEGHIVPKILDFGISKLLGDARARFNPKESTAGTILGSPAYMSPEQTSGEDLDPRADIWSLGVLLYKAISSTLPFSGASFATLMLAINTNEPVPLESRVPGLPREVYTLVHRCLARRRGDRFANATALADAIDELLERHELPVLEFSELVGEMAAIPSEHMKILELRGAKADTRVLDEPRPLTADVTDAHPTSLPPVAAPPAQRRGAAVALLAAVMVVATFAIRQRPGPEPSPAAASTLAPNVAAPPEPIVVEPVIPVASVTASASASVSRPVESISRPVVKNKPGIAHKALVRPGF